MQVKLLISVLLYTVTLSAQDKESYLTQNASALTANYAFPQKDMDIVGFGAYHGSAATEDAEIAIVTSLLKNNALKYYFPETDLSIAYYFNEYLKTGNTTLLKDLVETYGTRIPQERTIEVFEKWKQLKAINDTLPEKKKIQILGADPIVTYKYTYRHLLSLLKTSGWKMAESLKETVVKDTTDFSPYYNSYSKEQLRAFVADYEANTQKYAAKIKDKPVFNYLINAIKTSFTDFKREKEIYNNYIKLQQLYPLKHHLQFFRYGFFHLEKHKERKAASFFSMLIDNGIYPKEKIISVLGYLTKSEVIWDDTYDDEGEYVESTTKGDSGIGDAPEEYFKGIDHLKKCSIAPITIFRLNTKNSPYYFDTDLIEVITKNQNRKIDYSTTSTLDYIDYAVLISNSKASRSIYTLQE